MEQECLGWPGSTGHEVAIILHAGALAEGHRGEVVGVGVAGWPGPTSHEVVIILHAGGVGRGTSR